LNNFVNNRTFSEIELYFNELVCEQITNIFKYWNKNRDRFPVLLKLALKYLCLLALSIDVEKMASLQGQIQIFDRSRMNEDTLENLLCNYFLKEFNIDLDIYIF